jgi:hypothetical protein
MDYAAGKEALDVLKKCAACRKMKNFSSFSRNKFARDGINPYCIECVNKKQSK